MKCVPQIKWRYYVMSKMFASSFPSKENKKKLILALSQLLWTGVKRNSQNKLMTFERIILRKMYGPVLKASTSRKRMLISTACTWLGM